MREKWPTEQEDGELGIQDALASPDYPSASFSGEHEPRRMAGALRMLKLEQVIEQTGLKKTTIYKLQKLGLFPKSVPMTNRSVRWIESEVQRFLAIRAASRNDSGRAE
jgi:prophage regulatory protein